MNSKELGEKYDKIAEWWTDQIEGSNSGMQYVKTATKYAKKNSKALDIGCGSNTRIIGEALKNGFEATGIDVSGEMIKIARKAQPQVRFIHDDFIEWDAPERYDLIIAWDSIFHAPKEHQENTAKKMCGLLNKDGVLLFTAGGIDDERRGEMEGVAFEYGSLSYQHYLTILEKAGCKIILMERDQYPLDHMVFICQKN